MPRPSRLVVLLILALAPAALAQPPAPESVPKTVTELLEAHDHALVRALSDYTTKNPKATDVERAYMALFEKVIERDWYLEQEPIARKYLGDFPEGTVRPMAMIVATMARAQDGKFGEALTAYTDLMKGLGKEDQEEFAGNFADSLATAASAVGEYDVARKVYEILLNRFGGDLKLRDKIQDDLARIDMVGKPAPAIVVKDVIGNVFRLSDLKGKFVLVDFWATWCSPCIAELPNIQAAHTKFHDKGFEVISVSLDESAPPLRDFLATHKMPWTQIHTLTSGGDVVDAYGVNSIPATFLIGPTGDVVRIELRGPNLDKTLEKLIR